MSKKLAAKASLIQVPPLPAPPGPDGQSLPAPNPMAAPDARVKTAPGSMAHFMASQSSAVREAEELRERLKSFDGAAPVRQLDPALVRASRWSNRHAHAFADQAFAELKAEIASAGGNVQPACVRPLPAVLNRSTPDDHGHRYELVFGHRRHQACLELGLPLQAMVVEMSDQALFEAMERENRGRKNLSAWEQGCMYKRALDEGLYPSQRKLSEALGVDVSLVSKSLSLARLPDAVVNAFASPLDIQFRWAQPLAEALQRDPEAVLARAAEVQRRAARGAPATVLAALLGPASMAPSPAAPVQWVQGRAGRQAVLRHERDGRVVLSFAPGVLTPEMEARLLAQVEALLRAD